MKKTIIIAFLMLLAGNASAQWFDTLETIPGRYKKYYYPEWKTTLRGRLLSRA